MEHGYVLHSYFDNEINNTLEKGKVVKRPSASVKSPYMADILLFNKEENKNFEDLDQQENENSNKILAHTPSVGGYVDKGKEVLLYLNRRKNKIKSQC